MNIDVPAAMMSATFSISTKTKMDDPPVIPSSIFKSSVQVQDAEAEDEEEEEMEESQVSPFDKLPLEIMVIIFQHTSKLGKQACRLVCHEWRQIIDCYFTRFVGVLNDHTYDYICASTQSFESLIVNCFHRNLPERETKSKFRSKLALSPQNLIFTSGGSSDGSANSVGTTSPENVVALLKLNRQITSLRFRHQALKGIQSLPIHNLFLPNLTKLEITISREMMYDSKIFHQITEISMPSLTHVTFHVAKFIVFEHEKSGRFYLAMFEFIAKYRSTLLSVDMRNDYYLFFPLLSVVSIPLQVDQDELNLMLVHLLELKLKEFSYLFKRPECHPPYNLGLQLLENQNVLEKLKIEERNDSGILHPKIYRALERNSTTLTHFYWKVFRFADNAPFTEISPAFVQNLRLCTHLESLCLYGFRISSLNNILQHPERLKHLELEGLLNPIVLMEIQAQFVNLETFKYYHLCPLDRSLYDDLAQNLKGIMRLPKLKTIHWFVQGLFLHYVPKRTDISIKRGRKGRHYYVITFTR